MPIADDRLLELFFTQSLDGFFMMMLDEPVEWGAHVDKEAALDHVFRTQRMTHANEAVAAQFGTSLQTLIGMTPNEFFAHNLEEGRSAWRAMFDAGQLHVETDERRIDGSPMRIEGHYMCVYDDAGRIAGHFGIQRDITERYKAQAELERSREELRALATRLESIREEERTRIARELHDELGQALTGLKLDLSWIDQRLARVAPAEIQERGRNVIARLDLLMDSVRRIVTELRPSVLDQLGLPAAIEWQSQEFASRVGLSLDLDIESDGAATPDRISSGVFRMLQEALTNVARHAQASQLSVVFRQNPDSVALEVTDNGRGISPNELRGTRSLGLLSLRERALACGGTIEITGESGSGTTVSLRLPLRSTVS